MKSFIFGDRRTVGKLSISFSFALIQFAISLKVLPPLSQPIRIENKLKRDSVARVFPHLSRIKFYFEF